MRKRKEKALKVRQYVNSNENDYKFDIVCLILLCSDFVICVWRYKLGNNLMRMDLLRLGYVSARRYCREVRDRWSDSGIKSSHRLSSSVSVEFFTQSAASANNFTISRCTLLVGFRHCSGFSAKASRAAQNNEAQNELELSGRRR